MELRATPFDDMAFSKPRSRKVRQVNENPRCDNENVPPRGFKTVSQNRLVNETAEDIDIFGERSVFSRNSNHMQLQHPSLVEARALERPAHEFPWELSVSPKELERIKLLILEFVASTKLAIIHGVSTCGASNVFRSLMCRSRQVRTRSTPFYRPVCDARLATLICATLKASKQGHQCFILSFSPRWQENESSHYLLQKLVSMRSSHGKS